LRKGITYLSYNVVVIKVNAQKFFRIEVSTSWGHLIKERKTLTKPEETIKEAKRAYRDGIKKAWDVYTQDNIIVQEAKNTLNSAIDEAYKSCLPEHGEELPQTEYEQANRLYIRTLYEIHSKFADTIGQNWVAFMKDMETTSWLTKKNTLKSKQ
jgi:5-methylthioribose kinase